MGNRGWDREMSGIYLIICSGSWIGKWGNPIPYGGVGYIRKRHPTHSEPLLPLRAARQRDCSPCTRLLAVGATAHHSHFGRWSSRLSEPPLWVAPAGRRSRSFPNTPEQREAQLASMCVLPPTVCELDIIVDILFCIAGGSHGISLTQTKNSKHGNG